MLCATVYVKTATHIPFLRPHVPKLPPSTQPIITLHTFLHKVMRVSGRFITLQDSKKRKCHLGTLLLRPFAFFISQSKRCACKSWARWAKFHFSEGKLLSSATRNHHLHAVQCHCPLPPIYHRGLTRPIYTEGIWQEMSEHSDLNMCARVRVHVRVCVCVCVCEARWSRRGVGKSNLSHRGAETGGQIRSRPRITPTVSMNEMTGLPGY